MDFLSIKDAVDGLSPAQKFVALIALGLISWGAYNIYKKRFKEEEEFFEDYLGMEIDDKEFSKEFKTWLKSLKKKKRIEVASRLSLMLKMMKDFKKKEEG